MNNEVIKARTKNPAKTVISKSGGEKIVTKFGVSCCSLCGFVYGAEIKSKLISIPALSGTKAEPMKFLITTFHAVLIGIMKIKLFIFSTMGTDGRWALLKST